MVSGIASFFYLTPLLSNEVSVRVAEKKNHNGKVGISCLIDVNVSVEMVFEHTTY